MQGTRLLGGCYELGGLLGRGGMADVREAWDHRANRPVAIKLLHPQFLDRADIRRRFRAEADVVAALEQPGIVAVYDSGEVDGVPYIVMERLPGDTLADRIAHGPVPPESVRTLLDGVLGALAASHARGILHRDIKPDNLLRAEGDHYKLGDFGIAKTNADARTMAGQVFGTLAYLSPQRLCGVTATASDDLFAIGVVGYEALTGRHPFGTEADVSALVHAIASADRTPLGVLLPAADPALTGTLERALAPDPAMRFATADEMRAALRGQPLYPVAPAVCARPTVRRPTKVLTAPLPLAYAPPLPMAAPPQRRRRRLGQPIALAIVGLLAVLAVIALAAGLDASTADRPAGTSSSVAPLPDRETSTLPTEPFDFPRGEEWPDERTERPDGRSPGGPGASKGPKKPKPPPGHEFGRPDEGDEDEG